MSFFDRFRRSDVPTTDDFMEAADAARAADAAQAGEGAATDPTDGVGEAAQAPAAVQPAETAALEPADSDEVEAETEAAEPAPAGAGRGRRRVLLGAAAATALVLAGSGIAVASAHKTVDIDLDGQTYTFSTFAGSVDGLLDEAGIEIGPHDSVVPGAHEALRDGSDVVVRTGDQITITSDGEQDTIWTTALTAEEALSQFIGSDREVSLQASRSSDGRTELDLPLVTDGEVTVVADGDERSLQIDGSATLQQVLVRAEITLGSQDETIVTVAEDGTTVVTVVRHTTETRTQTRTVEHDSVQRETDDLYEGQSRVVQEGRDGERTITLQDQLVDGEVTETKVLSNEVTTEPVDRVVEVGTAERPAPEPSRSSSSGSGDSGSGDSGGSSVGSGVWAALAQCESGGDPTTNTGNGYYGLYQFSLGTWQSVGGSGLPSDASASEQTHRAQILQQRSGWGQWPYCSAKLGLR